MISKIYYILKALAKLGELILEIGKRWKIKEAKTTLEENKPKIQTIEDAKESARRANDIFRK